jgi:hypothetical protein
MHKPLLLGLTFNIQLALTVKYMIPQQKEWDFVTWSLVLCVYRVVRNFGPVLYRIYIFLHVLGTGSFKQHVHQVINEFTGTNLKTIGFPVGPWHRTVVGYMGSPINVSEKHTAFVFKTGVSQVEEVADFVTVVWKEPFHRAEMANQPGIGKGEHERGAHPCILPAWLTSTLKMEGSMQYITPKHWYLRIRPQHSDVINHRLHAYLWFIIIKKNKTKLRGFSPRANYTDQSTTACRRRQCQLCIKRGVA